MRPHLLRCAGFLLSVSPVTLVAAVVMTPGRNPLKYLPGTVSFAALLLALSSLVAGEGDWTVLLGLTASAWVIACARARPPLRAHQALLVRQGAVGGLYLLALLAILQVSGVADPLFAGLGDLLEPVTARLGLTPILWPLDPPGRARLWTQHPNLLAASVLVPTLAAMALGRSVPARLIALAPALVVVALTGSRSALLGLVLGLAVLLVGDATRRLAVGPGTDPKYGGSVSRGTLVGGIAIVGLALLLLTLVPGLRGRFLPWLAPHTSTDGRPTVGLSVQPPTGPLGNLFQSSEDLSDGVWWRPFVAVEQAKAQSSTAGGAAWSLTRTGGGPSDRIQQRVRMEVDRPYVLSFEYVPGSHSPGVVAWGTQGAEPYGFLVAEVQSGGLPVVWSGDATGAMVLDTVDAQDQGNSWVRVSMSFRLVQGPPRAVEIGIAPDMAGPVGTAALLVRKVMLHEGNLALPYSPTYPPDRSGLRASSSVDTRVRVYGEVWRLVTQRPLFGWGPRGFSHVSDSTSDTVVAGVAHEHSLPLWAALRYGLVGVAAVVLLFVGYYRLRPYQLAALAAVAAANLFDLTFWSAGVVLTLSLVIGADVPEPVSDREGVR